MDTIEERSPEIDKLAKALSDAQGWIESAERTGKNSFIGNTYADLTSIMETVRGPLAGEGLAVTQTFLPMGGQTHLVTTLLHESGQFIRGFLPLLGVKDHHSLGSAITYARRHSLASILGVTPQGDMADDDAEAAMGRGTNKRAPAKRTPKKSPAKSVSAGDPVEDTVAEAAQYEQDEQDAKAKCIIIIKQVRGATTYLRGKDIDPGDPPPNIRDKILQLGPDGLTQKIKDAKKAEADAIVDEAETVETLVDGDKEDAA